MFLSQEKNIKNMIQFSHTEKFFLCNKFQSTRKVYFFMALVFVGMGTGGIKTNVGPFGAEQIEQYGEAAVRSFFNWQVINMYTRKNNNQALLI